MGAISGSKKFMKRFSVFICNKDKAKNNNFWYAPSFWKNAVIK